MWELGSHWARDELLEVPINLHGLVILCSDLLISHAD